jgi:hypothetical protein
MKAHSRPLLEEGEVYGTGVYLSVIKTKSPTRTCSHHAKGGHKQSKRRMVRRERKTIEALNKGILPCV